MSVKNINRCVRGLNHLILFTVVCVSLSFGGYAYASVDLCDEAGPVQLLVRPTMTEIDVDHSKSRNALKAMSLGTYSPYGVGAQTHTSGLTRGKISTSSDVELSLRKNTRTGETCVWYGKVTVELNLENTVFIDRAYRRASCPYRAIYAHEMKHVNVDRQLINNWSRRIYADLRGFFQKSGYPKIVSASALPAHRQIMMNSLESMLNSLGSAMQAERELLQMKVDTRSEYENVQKQCDARDWGNFYR